ncbi:MAG: GNAT family N-acetyltransferase [Nitrososphaeraceae archaeon]|jgi:GNAT superfamily N-acetyltransferase
MNITIRPLVENDLSEADRIFRLSFGTFLGISDPMTFGGDTDYVKSRFYSDPFAAFAAEVDGKLVGSNFTANWGSVGFFGPLTVHPNYWSQGVARRLMEPTMQLFSRWNTKLAGLFTFANSPKHVALYQKFGFWPRFLTAIMSKELTQPRKDEPSKLKWSRYSEEVSERTRKDEKHLLKECSKLTNSVYEGLSLESEIRSVKKQNLGDTILLWRQNGSNNDEDSPLTGVAVCHCGANSEAGSNTCYIKFGAVKSGPDRGKDFENLLRGCETFAAEHGLTHITAGVNTARHQAYTKMLSNSFHTDMLGIAMQRGNDEGYNRHNVHIIDDWR